MDCSPPGSSVHGILQARILGRVAIFSSKGSSWPRDWHVCLLTFLHWQAGSLPLNHLGSPYIMHLYKYIFTYMYICIFVFIYTSLQIHIYAYTISLVAQTLKNLRAMQEIWVWPLAQEDSLEKEMGTHPSSLGWRIPWTEEPGGLQSMGLPRIRHN